jgi:hypothetical protein
MENSMLSFQVVNSGREIQIACDEQGMTTLIGALERIRHTGGHVHLRAPSNGGRELSEKTLWGDDAVGEVVITCNGDDN